MGDNDEQNLQQDLDQQQTEDKMIRDYVGLKGRGELQHRVGLGRVWKTEVVCGTIAL